MSPGAILSFGKQENRALPVSSLCTLMPSGYVLSAFGHHVLWTLHLSWEAATSFIPFSH